MSMPGGTLSPTRSAVHNGFYCVCVSVNRSVPVSVSVSLSVTLRFLFLPVCPSVCE